MRLFEHTFISGNTCICRNYEWPEVCRERSLQGVSSVVSFYKLELDQWVEVTCRSWVYYQVLGKNLPQSFTNWINSTLSCLITRQSGPAHWNWLPAPFCVLSLECQMRLPSPRWCLSHLEPLEGSQPSLLSLTLCVWLAWAPLLYGIWLPRGGILLKLSIFSRLCCLDSVIQAASHQADRKELLWAGHSERLRRWKTVGTRMSYQQKCGLVVARLPSIRDVRGLSGRLTHQCFNY